MKEFLARLAYELSRAFWRSFFEELRRSRQIIVEEPTDEDKDLSDLLAERLREQLRGEARPPGAGPHDVPQDFSPHDCPHRDACAVRRVGGDEG